MSDIRTTHLAAIDRRTTLRWLVAATAAGQLAACGEDLKGVRAWPELPAILITGYLSERAGRIIVEGKAAQVITKPIKLDELLEAVKRVLQSKSE